MKKQTFGVVLVVLCAGIPLFLLMNRAPTTTSLETRQAHDQTTTRKTVQLAGEVLDIACYLDNDLHGGEHKKCATACIRDGQPIGLLDDQGRVYLLIEDHTAKTAYRLLPSYAAERIDLDGEIIDRGGVQSILVRDVRHPSRTSAPRSPSAKGGSS